MPKKVRASESGIQRLREAMKLMELTQASVTEKAGFARSTLNQILSGQWVRQTNLEQLCSLLGLEVGQVLEQEVSEEKTSIDDLVQQLRKASESHLTRRCGIMKILDMKQPIDSGAVYTDVNILERIAGKSRRDIPQMMEECGAQGVDRFFLGAVKQKRVEGLEAVLKEKQLMILGRPGAGKTTFLKRLAIVCLKNDFLADRLPIFVTLKEFAETEGKPGILEFVAGTIENVEYSVNHIKQVLQAGRGLILLDGLDEVMEVDHDRVIREIRELSERYGQNHIVITCRIAAGEYTFERFTDVEMSDFDDEQIQSFANKWFQTKEDNPESTTGKMFWKELEARKPVKELATNPLLLTLLCLEFDDSATFPQSRSELYGRALNVLLSKWDGSRRIKRGEEVYKGLSLKRKESMLGQLAMFTFDRGEYFFKEKVATQQIENYIRKLPGAKEDPAALEVDSQAVLKSIEARHGLLSERAIGIYSFSHLTFHEYFTAKNILDFSNPEAHKIALDQLVDHIGEKRWNEVFLMVVEDSRDAEYLLRLMKQRIDRLISDDPKLQEILKWTKQKSESVESTHNFPIVRAFYFALDNALALDRDLAIDSILDLTRAENPDLNRLFQEIYDQLPNRDDHNQFMEWWQQNGEAWIEDLRQIMIQHRNIGHDWKLTEQQQEILQKYYDANRLLTECLKSEVYVNPEARDEIENTMFLPISEIEKWKPEKITGKQSG